MKKTAFLPTDKTKWLVVLLGLSPAVSAICQTTPTVQDTSTNITSLTVNPSQTPAAWTTKFSFDSFVFDTHYLNGKDQANSTVSATKSGVLYGTTISFSPPGQLNWFDLSFREGKQTGDITYNQTVYPGAFAAASSTWDEGSFHWKFSFTGELNTDKNHGFWNDFTGYIGFRFVDQDEVDSFGSSSIYSYGATGNKSEETIERDYLVPLGLCYSHAFSHVFSGGDIFEFAPRIEGHIDLGGGQFEGSAYNNNSTWDIAYDAGAVGTLNFSYTHSKKIWGFSTQSYFVEGGYQYDYWEHGTLKTVSGTQKYYGPYARIGVILGF